MKKVVFYSWQSDLPSNRNRNFIQTALERAIRAIGRDETSDLSPVIDRDTDAIAGAPNIAAEIFAKIATTDVFVADVSIVSGDAARASPNPNVLIELGYAVAQLGWNRIILIMNSAFGGPELLPFDLRGHRTIVYACREDTDRPPERGALQGRLEGALRDELGPDTEGFLPTGREAKIWWGKWAYDGGPTVGGHLFIKEVGTSGFLFELETNFGGHTGEVTAWARLITTDLAYCRVSNEGLAPDGELIFRRSGGGGRRFIEIDEVTNCILHHGARARFSGSFIRDVEPLIDCGFINEIELARLHVLLGQHLDPFRSCVGDLHITDNAHETLPSVRMISGGLAGLYTIMEYILMVGGDGSMWAAYLNLDAVTYFTNSLSHRDRFPIPIADWAARFADKQIVMCPPTSPVSSIGVD